MSDEALMELLQEGSKSAFNEIYNRYSQRLLYFMFRLLNNDESLAQDKLHDIFLRLIEHPEKFNTTRIFKSWIFTVAANECKKHFRNETHSDASLLDDNETPVLPSVFSYLENISFNRALQLSLEQLSYVHKCTFILRFQEHLSIREIGKIMDCPEGTVKSRIHHTTKILAKRLKAFNPIAY